MARAVTDTCCLTLPLTLEKWQSDRLEKRFEIARQIYNTLLNFELKKLRRLEQSDEYAGIHTVLQNLYQEGKKETQDYKRFSQRRKELLKKAGFSEYTFSADMKPLYKHFSDSIASKVAVLGIAKDVWRAFDKLLFGNGKSVHFKKRGELKSVKGYNSAAGASGGTEIIFRGTYIEWNKLKLPVQLDPGNKYETEMLQKRVKYCRIIKKAGRTKPRWYVQLMLEGRPAVKCDRITGKPIHPVGNGPVGIDIGPQTIAYVSNTEAKLQELADGVKNIEREKRLLLRKMDRSRRALNPDNYSDNGTVKRGIKLNWVKSNRYLRLQHDLSALLRDQAELRKRQHNELANHLLSLGNRFFVEDMEWPALTHRAKKTEISEKTGKYKRKKRFGKSVSNKAPAMLTAMLNQKLTSRGLNGIVKVPTKVKASQYNHLTGVYTQKPLSQRWNDMPDGKRIQRDLYSAFLLQHMNETLNGFDNAKLRLDYPRFIEQHDDVILNLQNSKHTISSMGIRRTAS